MRLAPRGPLWNSAPRRGWSIAAAGLVHGAALVILLLSQTNVTSPVARERHLATFDSSPTEAQKPALPKPKQPIKVPPQPRRPVLVPPPLIELPSMTPQVVALLEQADAQSANGGCDLTAPVQAALQSSQSVQRELPGIPVGRRSVANAIALWNQTWVEPDTQLTPQVLDTIRRTVASTISAASSACRLQPQGGPRLIYLPGSGKAAGNTTILALGSGEWTWQQIADTAQPDFVSTPEEQQALVAHMMPSSPLPPFVKTAFNP